MKPEISCPGYPLETLISSWGCLCQQAVSPERGIDRCKGCKIGAEVRRKHPEKWEAAKGKSIHFRRSGWAGVATNQNPVAMSPESKAKMEKLKKKTTKQEPKPQVEVPQPKQEEPILATERSQDQSQNDTLQGPEVTPICSKHGLPILRSTTTGKPMNGCQKCFIAWGKKASHTTISNYRRLQALEQEYLALKAMVPDGALVIDLAQYPEVKEWLEASQAESMRADLNVEVIYWLKRIVSSERG